MAIPLARTAQALIETGVLVEPIGGPVMTKRGGLSQHQLKIQVLALAVFVGPWACVPAGDHSASVDNTEIGSSSAALVATSVTIWPATAVPSTIDVNDTRSVELGVRFRADVNGQVTGIRFYKAALNLGTHTGTLWSAEGVQLSPGVVFSSESGSGWQTVFFPSPINIMAGKTYVASYHAPQGHYSATAGDLKKGVDNAPLHALPSGPLTGGNGVYTLGSVPQFPTSAYNDTNYWVDVVFVPTTALSIWSDAVPSPSTEGDASPVELGVKFRSDTDGQVTGIRFYKGARNTGVHTGTLWSSSGEPLSETATFTNESSSSSGWQTMTFSTPINITAGRTYVASYHAPNGYYTGTVSGLTNSVDNPPLHALGGKLNGGNGVYVFGTTPQFPSNNSSNTNYWVDVLFVPVSPNTIWPSTVVPPDGTDTSSVELGVKFRADMDGQVTGIRFYKGAGNGGQHTGTLWSSSGLALSPTTAFTNESSGSGWQSMTFAKPIDVIAGMTYVASYHAPQGHYSYSAGGLANGVDNPPLHALDGVYVFGSTTQFPSLSFGNANYWVDVLFVPVPPRTIWPSTTVPGTTAGNDGSSVELGVKFRADADGQVTGIRFYKGVGNNGPHTGTLWSSTGVPLSASVTFVGESVSGWQTATFPSPIPVTAGATYVASYHAPQGHYAFDAGGLANGVDSAPLHALAGASNGGNGVYAFSSATTFPSLSFGNANYWVDVVYRPMTKPTSVFSPSAHPLVEDSGDGRPIQVGMKFKTELPAKATGIRFYKDTTNTGPHIGYLWGVSGTTPLATASFTPETEEGWQQANFATPVDLAADTEYTVSYWAPYGHYSATPGGLTDSKRNGALYAISGKDPSGTSVNGVFSLASNVRPVDSFYGANYWVDIVVSLPWAASPRPAALRPGTNGSGPILVATDPNNGFTEYVSEILTSEGFHEFAWTDAGNINTLATLAGYSTLVVGDTALTNAQVNMITQWVSTGGNLIALRPRANLNALLGLNPCLGTLNGGYVTIDTSQAPGSGIEWQSMQFHGPADLHTLLSDTRAVATLYRDANTATPYAAVSLRSVGTGRAQAFMYDLARSVVYTRQGNPDWQGQDRDHSGLGPGARGDDMFFGAALWDNQPDWIDFNKIQIPQADEQQHLLANMLTGTVPLVRLNFLPNGLKAAIVMTGDGHPGDYTQKQFQMYMDNINSPAGCNTPGSALVADWKCFRYTAYDNCDALMTDATGNYSAPTASAAYNYQKLGFEYAMHLDVGGVDYNPFTAGSSYFKPQLDWFAAKYGPAGVLSPTTNRTHNGAFVDYASEPRAELDYGIQLDTTYFYWPGGNTPAGAPVPDWVQNRPGLFTGTGLIQPFADSDGRVVKRVTTEGKTLKSYQATTQVDDVSYLYPFENHFETLLGNATDTSKSYYTIVTALCHLDDLGDFQQRCAWETSCAQAALTVATAHGVPVVSARQMLDWILARENTAITYVVYSSGSLSFNLVNPAHNLQLMIPLAAGSRTLRSISLGSKAVSYSSATIKGVNYALVNQAAVGKYTVGYN
jgi:hypothetical protein